MNRIVKRAGHTENYDERKLYASIFRVCTAVREPDMSAELIAAKVCADFKTWLSSKHEVTSHDIRRVAAKHLEAYQPDAAWLYQHHRNLS